MLKILFSAVLLVSSVLFTTAPAPYIIDSAHSQINFVAEARLISAHGSFDKWEADVSFDPEKVENSTVKLTIDASSINTRVQRRDDHLRSKDFFWVEKFPTITFVSKQITSRGGKNYDVMGDLTVRDVTKEIKIPLEMVFYEAPRARFRGSFPISRKEFGITFDSKMNPIQDQVKVQVDINVVNKEAAEKAQKARQQSSN